jgi:ArsR family transcriptional regulator
METVVLFSVLNNEIRQRMLALMKTNGEVCVCEFVDSLSISQPSASKALSLLKNSGLVLDRRDANWTYYRLNENLADWCRDVLNAMFENLATEDQCKSDQQNFQRSVVNTSRDVACS